MGAQYHCKQFLTGYSIFITAKYGSRRYAHVIDEIATPSLELIGVKQSELQNLAPKKSKLSLEEKNKAKATIDWPLELPDIKPQLVEMLRVDRKLDADLLLEKGEDYFVREYLAPKLYAVLGRGAS